MRSVLHGCLVVGGMLLILVGLSVAALAPRAVQEGHRFAVPFATLVGNGHRFGSFVKKNVWRPPAAATITGEQLERFLAVRAHIDALCARHAPALATLPEEAPANLDEAAEALQLLSGLIPEQMKVYMEQSMTPAEYRYVEAFVYGRWRHALQAEGSYPDTLRIAAAEMESAATAEADAVVAARLREIAADLRARPAPPPDGVTAEIHELLLAHQEEIERLSLDAYTHLHFPEL